MVLGRAIVELFVKLTLRKYIIFAYKPSSTCPHLYRNRPTVYALMQELDPQGLIRRRGVRFHERLYINHGVNYLIHIDQYDKLRHWGLCIHGAIDG